MSRPTTVDDLTLEEQAALGSGADFWRTKAVGTAPSILMTDGPNGLRKQEGDTDHLGLSGSVPATCFPPAVALAQTWDPALAERMGEALGRESQAAGIQLLLGPGINIKRDPRGGRNFEYFSEDPLVSAAFGTAWVRGLQREGVGASLKHFAVNNQEHDRMRVSANIDPRPLREIYLRAFERVVRDAQPWTVMCSYNRINGVHASQHRWLLTDLLRTEWGFDGAVVSDWGAVADRVAAVEAGLDLQMPGDGGAGDARVVAAVQSGQLDAAAVEQAAVRIQRLAALATDQMRSETTWDPEAHHALAREIASRAIVLLRNDHAVLPLEPRGTIAVIGEFAEHPRYQGGGSSHVNAIQVDVPLEEIRRQAGGARVTYAPGFSTSPDDDKLGRRDAAVELAGDADVAVLFLGLLESQESEGFDRADIELPADQLALLTAVAAAQPRTVVVLCHGGVLRLAPVAAEPVAILDAALLGEAGGSAIADVLFGIINPSGRLAETVPKRLEDSPAYLSFPGERSQVRYGEGLFVGYRWYDARVLDVTFPFGHGLSYTTFEHSAVEAVVDRQNVRVRMRVRNAGARAGREVVQVYASLPDSVVSRPVHWLVGFGSIELAPGEARELVIDVPLAELAYWDEELGRWVVEPGDYRFLVGASSRDLRHEVIASIAAPTIRHRLSEESSVAEILGDPTAGPVFADLFAQMFAAFDTSGDTDFTPVLDSLPFGRFLGSFGDAVSDDLVDDVLRRANRANGFH